mgnify:FL=1
MKQLRRIIIILLTASATAFAQSSDHILRSSEYLWAEGTDVRPSVADEQALSGLLTKLAATDILPVDKHQRRALWQTYSKDLRNCTQSTVTPSGSIIRYLPWRDIDKVFKPRWRKVRELIQSAEKATDTDKARTYAFWAETYLSSLPQGEPELRTRLSALKAKLGPGRTDAVKMRNVENEVSAILQALSVQPKKAAEPTPKTKPTTTKPIPEPKRAPFGIRVSPIQKPSELSPLPISCIPGDNNLVDAAPRQPEPYWRWSALLSADICTAPAFGAIVIGCGKRLGVYASAKTNFTASDSSYDCLSDGTTSFGTIWASGKARQSRISISAGPVVRLSSAFSIYAGAGFGRQTLLWEDTSSQWARVSDHSCEGLLLDAGLLYTRRHLTFGLGINEIGFSAFAATLSIGWTF